MIGVTSRHCKWRHSIDRTWHQFLFVSHSNCPYLVFLLRLIERVISRKSRFFSYSLLKRSGNSRSGIPWNLGSLNYGSGIPWNFINVWYVENMWKLLTKYGKSRFICFCSLYRKSQQMTSHPHIHYAGTDRQAFHPTTVQCWVFRIDTFRYAGWWRITCRLEDSLIYLDMHDRNQNRK